MNDPRKRRPVEPSADDGRDGTREAERDPTLAAALRALDVPATAEDIAALRVRVRLAAGPALAERARGRGATRRVESWLDVTSRFGRWAIPASLAASLLAAVLLQRSSWTPASTVARGDDLYAFSVVADTSMSTLVTVQWLLPTSADDVLLSSLSEFAELPDARRGAPE